MIKTELSYNPYTMITEVKFNGHAPRINSLIEKYDKFMLHEWINLVPKIFYDEMNGYDFELEYSGTKEDYQELIDSFRGAGVTEKQVQLIFKNEISGRKATSNKLEMLLDWLENNSSRKFDFNEFKEKHADIFDDSHSYIVMHGDVEDAPKVTELNFVIENINKIEELENTKLNNTPILYCVKIENKEILQNDMKTLLNRNDVRQEQIFFAISTELNEDKIERILRDLGIKTPQIVKSIDDSKIISYMEVYPISIYICHVLKVLKNKANELENKIKLETEVATADNKDIYTKIEKMDKELELLRMALDKFEQRDNLIIPSKMVEAKKNLIDSIKKWNDKKTKITDYVNAEKCANNFNMDTHKRYSDFYMLINSELENYRNSISTEYLEWYKKGKTEPDFVVFEEDFPKVVKQEIQTFKTELLGMKHERYIEAKEDLFGFFLKAQNTSEKEKVLEQTWNFQEWREYVVNIVDKEVNDVPRQAFEILKGYADYLANSYICKLKALIESKIGERDCEKAFLSKEEQMLQEDNEWIANLLERIIKLERG